tara:strand:- start:56 stop:490 length:435 start_codon:yes stop_codon:yes gene_type:complete
MIGVGEFANGYGVGAYTAVVPFWGYVPASDRIVNLYTSQTITQDKDAALNYWLNFGFVVSPLTIASVAIDPGNELPIDKPTITSMGPNTTELTDSDGNTYPAGTVVGVVISGGSLMERYDAVIRLTLNSGESDDRTLSIDITDL